MNGSALREIAERLMRLEKSTSNNGKENSMVKEALKGLNYIGVCYGKDETVRRALIDIKDYIFSLERELKQKRHSDDLIDAE